MADKERKLNLFDIVDLAKAGYKKKDIDEILKKAGEEKSDPEPAPSELPPAENAEKDGVYTDIIDEHFISLLYSLAPLHDVGKIVVSDQILKKPGKLTPEEFEEMKKHASAGGKVVRQILSGITDDEFIDFASDIATYHHEKWDGSGYPEHLSGDKIPLSARIMAIADVYDALTSERCYKKAMSPEKAFTIIQEESGTHFDPKLVEVFLKHKEEFII